MICLSANLVHVDSGRGGLDEVRLLDEDQEGAKTDAGQEEGLHVGSAFQRVQLTIRLSLLI